MQEPVLNETLCRCCSAAPHLLLVSPANFPILSTPSEGLEKNLLSPIFLLTSVFPHLLPPSLSSYPSSPSKLGQLVFAGDCRVNGEIKFHCCF